MWRVTTACVTLYKAGVSSCADADADNLCCSRQDKEVWANAWSLREKAGSDTLVTTNATERVALLASGLWLENCHPIAAPTAFCVDTSGAVTDGRNGPFMLYNSSTALPPPSGTLASVTVALYRCVAAAGAHFLSNDPECEGRGSLASLLGWTADRPGGEALRALWRCQGAIPGSSWTHALDFPCDLPDRTLPLGWVR